MQENPACESHAVNAAAVHHGNEVSATMPRSDLPSRFGHFMHYEEPFHRVRSIRVIREIPREEIKRVENRK